MTNNRLPSHANHEGLNQERQEEEEEIRCQQPLLETLGLLKHRVDNFADHKLLFHEKWHLHLLSLDLLDEVGDEEVVDVHLLVRHQLHVHALPHELLVLDLLQLLLEECLPPVHERMLHLIFFAFDLYVVDDGLTHNLVDILTHLISKCELCNVQLFAGIFVKREATAF